jgi:hypothetical protein
MSQKSSVLQSPQSVPWALTPDRSVLSRKARSMTGIDEFREFAFGWSIDRTVFHQSIADDVWRNFARRHYSTAVFEAMRAV